MGELMVIYPRSFADSLGTEASEELLLVKLPLLLHISSG